MRSEAGDRWIASVLGLTLPKAAASAEGNPFKSVKEWAAKRKAAKAARREQAAAALPVRRDGGGDGEPPPLTPEQIRTQTLQALRRKQAFGSHPQALADRVFAALAVDDQEKMTTLLGAARSQEERNFLLKGLASGHSLGEIARFAEEIRGKDPQWMMDNLLLTGDSRGKGIQQQWVMSCQATISQAVKGMLDPIYALELHKAVGDVSTVRDPTDSIATEQKAWLESRNPETGRSGKATPLRDYNADPSKPIGKGRSGVDLLNNLSAATGLRYETVYIDDAGQRAAAIADIAAKLADGLPVPLSVGETQGELAHYVLAVAVQEGPPRSFYIHDPGTGETVIVPEADIANNAMGLPSGWDFLNKYEKPHIRT